MESFFLKLSVMLVPGLMAITCHEVSHGYVANRLGDSTARLLGRLTLNPLKHLDIIGTLMVFLVGIGWAKPVPVNFGNLRNPKRDMIWVAAAGPITNFALALLSALALRAGVALAGFMTAGSQMDMVLYPVLLMLAFSVYINLLLAIFNLIPVPPLDGGRVAVGLLPPRPALDPGAFRALWHDPHRGAGLLYQHFFTGPPACPQCRYRHPGRPEDRMGIRSAHHEGHREVMSCPRC